MTIRDDWDEGPPRTRTWQIGDQVRAVRRETTLHQAHIGEVGTVVAVYSPKHTAMVVHLHAVEQVVLVDFGPDEDRAGGRDTWSYADTDLADADEEAPAPKRHRRKQRANREPT